MSQTLDNLSYTWNNAGTTFTGIKYSVTDTASASGSLLMDLQVGSSSVFNITKAGVVSLITASSNGGIGYGSNAYYGFQSAFHWTFANPNGYIGFAPSASASNADIRLYRDAANTLAQRNSTNAQTFRCYGTYTDGSNYRRLTQTMSTGGVAEIKPEGAGTGASGNVLHISGLPTSNPGAGILWNDAGTVKVGT